MQQGNPGKRGKEEVVCPESTLESAPRRNFVRKAALATAAAGIGGVLLGKNLVPESSAACTKSCIVIACNSMVVDNAGLNCGGWPGLTCFRCICTSQRLLFGHVCPRSYCCGIFLNYPPGEAISSAHTSCASNRCGLDFWTNYSKRMSITNSGLVGIGTCSPFSMLEAVSSGNLIGRFVNNASSGDRTALMQVQNGDSTPADWNLGVAGACNALKIPDGAFYIQHANPSTTPAALLINKCGSIGIGTSSTPTTLRVGGSFSAKLVSVSKSYAMLTNDYAVLASASSTSGITVTLPPAKTAAGMMVFIKKVDSNHFAVTVSRNGTTDTIEGKSSLALNKQYDSLELISDGSGVWYVLDNSKCHGPIS
jgi:hypothetical protein